MKLYVLILLVFMSLFGVRTVAQVDESKAVLLELENQLFHKKFNKKWNKHKKEDWEEKCRSATSMEEINTLFNQYSDLMAQMISFSMGNSYATNQLEFAEYLLKVYSVLPDNLLTTFDTKKREQWRLEVNQIIISEKEKLDK